jgi:hypothetical protein
MKNLRRLGISITLLCVLAVAAFAGDTSSPPCAPGDTSSPPCAIAQVVPDDSVAPGTVNSPPASGVEISITEVALDLLLDTLSVF